MEWPVWGGKTSEPPCVPECPMRSKTCHAECPAYAQFAAAKDAERAEKDAARAGMYSMHDRVKVSEKVKRIAKNGGMESFY